MPRRPILNLVLGANIIWPPCCLHKQHAAMISRGNVLKSCLPLVRVPGMFFQHRCYLLDALGVFPVKNLISDNG